MARNMITSLKKDFVHCTICKEVYNEPKMLPCLHSFCLLCLEKWARNSNNQPFTCPECRLTVDLPLDGVRGLPNNFSLVSLMERLEEINRLLKEQAERKCSMCTNGNDTYVFCLDCEYHICQVCKVTHDHVTRNTDHCLIPSDKLSDKKYLQRVLSTLAPFCESHKKEKIRYYCTQCSQLACQVCTTVYHQGHQNIQDVESIANSAKAQLNDLLETSKKDTVNARKHLEVTKKASVEMVSKISMLRGKVESRYNEICEKLRSDKEKLIEELQRIQEQQGSHTRNIERNISDRLDAANNTQKMTHAILQQNNEWEILQMKSELVASLNRLNTELNEELKPPRGKRVEFSPVKLGVVDKYQKRAASESERTSSENESEMTSSENLFKDNFIGEIAECIIL